MICEPSLRFIPAGDTDARIPKRPQTGLAAALLGATAVVLLMAPAALAQKGQGARVKYLYDFGLDNASNVDPGGALVQGRNGAMYGVVNFNDTKIFETGPGGNISVLWDSAAEVDGGGQCYSGLTLGADGMLYGVCSMWAYNHNAGGIIFRFDPRLGQDGFSILYTWPAFGEGNSEKPSPLTLGPDGNFYGTTRGDDANPYGTVYKITPKGAYTVIHAFQDGETDGAYPSIGDTEEGYPIPLTLGSDGNFYGTTDAGGSSTNTGTIYQVTPSGTVTLLFSFPEGYGTFTGVIELNGNLYGQTTLGGTNGVGTIYELTSDGAFATLHSFSKTDDNAAFPDFPFTIGSDGNLYNASQDYYSGGYGPESLYEITPEGAYTDLYSKFGVPIGCGPVKHGCQENSPLLLHTNGNFYGLTMKGPNNAEGGGTLFRATLKQAPLCGRFCRSPNPAIGLASWGRASATPNVCGLAKERGVPNRLRHLLEARMPAGAAKGRIVVATDSGELRSNIDVTPLR